MRKPRNVAETPPELLRVNTRVDAAWVLRQLQERGAPLIEIAQWAADYSGGPLVACRTRVGDLLRDLEHRGEVLFDRGRWIAAPKKGGQRAAG